MADSAPEKINLEGWKYLLTCCNLDIYGKGKRRVGVIRDTGQMLIGYKADKVNRGESEHQTDGRFGA